jgi:FtsH-binding integral membrane protein
LTSKRINMRFNMYDPRNNYDSMGPYSKRGTGRANALGSRYQYQTLPYEMVGVQSGDLIGKVMALLAFSFIFAALGAFVGTQIGLSVGSYLFVVILGFVVLFALNIFIQKPGVNLFLLYLFTFLEGLALGPLISAYVALNLSSLLGEAFLMTAIVSLGLGFYAWTTKRDFSRLGDYLFVGVLLLLVVGIISIFFHSTMIMFLVSLFGIGIFSGYVLFYVQQAKYMANTLPNAIGLTASLFLTLLNLFLYILQLLTILQGEEENHR